MQARLDSGNGLAHGLQAGFYMGARRAVVREQPRRGELLAGTGGFKFAKSSGGSETSPYLGLCYPIVARIRRVNL